MGGLFAVVGILTAILFFLSAVGSLLSIQQLQESAVKLGQTLSGSTQTIVTIGWVTLVLYVLAGVGWLAVAVLSLRGSGKKKK